MPAHLALILLLALPIVSGPAVGGTLLVANKSEASVTLFGTPGYLELAVLPTGEGPHEVAVSPDGRRALVSNYGTRDRPGRSLTLVDVGAARVLGDLELLPATRPHGVEWLDDTRAVVTAEGISSLLLVDAEQRQVTATIPVDQDIAHMVAASGALDRAFVVNIGSGTATAVDLAAGRKIADLVAGEGSEGIALAGDESELWVTNRAADSVSVFSVPDLRPLAQIALPGFPIRAEADDHRGLVYITLPRADALVAIDRRTRQVRQRLDFKIGPDRSRKTLFGDMLPDSSIPIGVLLTADGKTLFVAHTNAHVVTAYDAQTLEREAVIRTGLEPDGMAWSPLEASAP